MQVSKRVEQFKLKIKMDSNSQKFAKHLQSESKKSTTERDLATIPWAIPTSDYICIYGRHFNIKTDHRPLTYLFSMENLNFKLTRIRLEL